MLSGNYKRRSKVSGAVKRNIKLVIQNNEVDNWIDLKEGEYTLIKAYTRDELIGIIFKCPGCVEPLGITTKDHRNEPGWNIDFEKLTATPSILHSRDGKGCGWHGFLTNGELIEC